MFSELEDDIMATVDFHKPITSLSNLINFDDAAISPVDHNEKFSGVHQDTSITFGREYLQLCQPRKRTFAATSSSERTNKTPRIDTADVHRGEPTAVGNPASV